MLEAIEDDFIQLQGNYGLFLFEAFVTVYLMLSQGVIADKFLMKSLENLTERYHISQGVAGILIAFGVAVPEVVVTILSFQRHGIKMTEFGVATILGSVCFATCLIPAVAHLVNYGLRQPKPESTEEQLKHNEKLQRVFVREMTFIIAGLLSFYYFLAAGAITRLNLVLFLFLWIAYCYLFWTHLEPSKNVEA